MADLPPDILAWYAAIPGHTPALERFRHVVVFAAVEGEPFAAASAAEHACAAVDLTAGSSQSGSPKGLFHRGAYVSKWRGLSSQDRAQLDGMILGGDRQCATCAVVTLKPLAEYGAEVADGGH